MERSRANRKRKGRKKYVIGFILFIMLLIGGGFYGVREYKAGLEPQEPGSEKLIEVKIPQGASQEQIVKILDENGLIRSALHFNIYNKLEGGEGHFQAGDYVLSPRMSLKEIVTALKQGYSGLESLLAKKVTLPEGITIEEMAKIIGKETDISRDEFMKAVQDEKLIKELYDMYPGILEKSMADDRIQYKLEGYLFPATYELKKGMTAADLVKEMFVKTASVYTKHEAAINASDFSFHEILTLASFIEKEGVTEEDRKMISGVFHNRLAIDMPLQTDISVAYILDQHKEHLTLDDVKTDSPYNLYINTGLGPGPVNNPSETAWEAALNPTPSDYLYFLADLQTGKVYYAKTYEEHLELKEKYVDHLITGSNEDKDKE